MSVPEKKLSRPSLYMHSVAEEEGAAKNASILGELDSSRSGMKLGPLLMAASLICVLGIGWAVWQGKLHRQAGDAAPLVENESAVQAGDDVVILATPPSEATAVSQSNQEAAQATASSSAPANIINESVAVESAQGATSATSAISLASVPSQQTESSSSQVAPVIGASVAAAVPAITENTKSAVRQEQVSQEQVVKATAVKSAPSQETAVAARQVKTPRKAVQAQKPAKDGDVELIAALLSRIAAKPEPTKPVNGAKQNSKAKNARSTGAKKDKKSAVSREQTQVARAGDEATAAQLKQCNRMSFFEAELCRFRTCNGRWGADPGCPDTAKAPGSHPN